MGFTLRAPPRVRISRSAKALAVEVKAGTITSPPGAALAPPAGSETSVDRAGQLPANWTPSKTSVGTRIVE